MFAAEIWTIAASDPTENITSNTLCALYYFLNLKNLLVEHIWPQGVWETEWEPACLEKLTNVMTYKFFLSFI